MRVIIYFSIDQGELFEEHICVKTNDILFIIIFLIYYYL